MIRTEQHDISAEQPNTSAELPIIRVDPTIISAESSVQDSNLPSKEKDDISKTSDAVETAKSKASKKTNTDSKHKAEKLPKSPEAEIEVHSSQRGSKFEEKWKLPVKPSVPTPKLTKTSIPTSDKEVGKGGVKVKNPDRPLQKSDGAESPPRYRRGSVHERPYRQQSSERRKRGRETTTTTSQIKVIKTDRADDDHPLRFNQRRSSFDYYG